MSVVTLVVIALSSIFFLILGLDYLSSLESLPVC